MKYLAKRKSIFTETTKAELFLDNRWQRFSCFVEYEAYPDNDELEISDFSALDEQKNPVEDKETLKQLLTYLEKDARTRHFSLMERAV